MEFAYRDLGQQAGGSTAIVRWQGSGANVLLLDPVNFEKYRHGRTPVFYGAGGRCGRSPARLPIPEDGHWYVVADFGGTSPSATVQILKSGDGKTLPTEEQPLVEAR